MQNRRVVKVCVAVLALVGASCSSSGTPAATSTTTKPTTTEPVSEAPHAVGETTMAFVDTHRTTAAHGPNPKLPQRTLVTTILYPAVGDATTDTPTKGAAPDKTGGPYPLIIFSHGFAATPSYYSSLLAHWAAAGFVVAAPLFPLSGSDTPGGPVSDLSNQPGDASFVVTSMLKASAGTKGALAGLIDPDEVGATGHSNGAVTTLGLVANTCCRDTRIKAAAVLSGTEVPFPNGHYDYAETPPLLVVHGTDDATIPYRDGVRIFNDAHGPKGLLTITGGDHESVVGMDKPSAMSVMATTTDFFDAYLRGDVAARKRLAEDDKHGGTTMHFVA